MIESTDKVKSLFLDAIENHSPSDWDRFLEDSCGPDVSLRGRVGAMLRAHTTLGPLPDETHRTLTEQPGSVIGQYLLKGQIGEGGFSNVYLAERQDPSRLKVAIKIIKPGMEAREVLIRFALERQALKLMDHPHIARVLDDGETDSGRPYFVMEYFDGDPITTYSESQQLSVRQRLELFVGVCDAVQHAHMKGIIHRDIKPSNVLVAYRDGVHFAKVIDFGVAKSIDNRLTGSVTVTHGAQVIGTPLYMSPEQACTGTLDIDTRADIYSLGVLLYELLTGTTPLECDRLRDKSYGELLRIISEEDLPKPSVRLKALCDAGTTIQGGSGQAELRTAWTEEDYQVTAEHDSAKLPREPRQRTESQQRDKGNSTREHHSYRALSKQLRGDLDWIVMKALDKERERRYQTAHEFAQDIQRFLADEPIQARSPSNLYRLRRFVRRNRLSVIAGTCVSAALILVIAFGVLAHWRSIKEAEARLMLDQARIARRDAEWRAIDAERKRLEQQRSRLEAEQRAQQSDAKRIDAEVNALVEEAQRLSSGVFPNFRRAIELFSEVILHRPEDGRLYLYRGSAHYETGRYHEAISDLEKSLVLTPSDGPAAHWLLAHSWQQLGDDENARLYLESAARQQPDGVMALVAQALAMPFQERGMALLAEAIDREPFNPLLYFYRGRIAYNLTLRKASSRNYRSAIEDLEKAHRGSPADLRIVEALSRVLVDFNFLDANPSRSLARAQTLIDDWFLEHPNDVDAIAALAQWQIASDLPAAAVQTCLSVSEATESHPLLLYQLGRAYRELGQHELATETFSNALKVNSDPALSGQSMVAIYAVRAASYFAMGRNELARQDLEQSLQAAPEQTWTFFDWYAVVSACRVLVAVSK